MVDGAFHQVAVAIAVARNRPAALAAITEFMNKAKTDGTVRKAFDNNGFTEMPLAP
jgi:polar amino acid transport system substrate-binding protein